MSRSEKKGTDSKLADVFVTSIMINADLSLGDNIRAFRKMKEITVEDLAEAVGISESHLKKIESGTRQPSMATYQRIVEILGIKMVIDNQEETVKEKCLAKAQNILLDKTESEVKYLVRILECAADNLDLVV